MSIYTIDSDTSICGNVNINSGLNISGNTILRGNTFLLSGININEICNIQGNLNVKGITTIGNISNIENTINNIKNSISNNINDIDLNDINIISCDSFYNSYIRIKNKNSSTLITPSAIDLINKYNLKPNMTFFTNITHNLGPSQTLFIEPGFNTYISLNPDHLSNEKTLLASALGFQNNNFTHHLITKIKDNNMITIYKI